MISYTRKSVNILGWQLSWFKLSALLFIASVALFILLQLWLPYSKKTHKETNYFGISVETPRSWRFRITERVITIVIEPKLGIWNRGSALISILGTPLTLVDPEATRFDNQSLSSAKGLMRDIKRRALLYDLDPSTIILSPPSEIANRHYQVTKATISLPTMSIPEGSSTNQLNRREIGLSQIIDLYAIDGDDNRSLLVTVYRGDSDELNKQAEEIVESIRFIDLSLLGQP